MMNIHIVVNDENIEYDDNRIGNEGLPVDEEWQERAKALLKAELKRKGVGYRALAEKLNAIGADESERNIANKISRGGFSAAFFLQCLSVIGCGTLRVNDD